MTDTVRAYYDGAAFVPIEPCEMPKGTTVRLSIVREAVSEEETTHKLAVFECITENLRELDDIEPLPMDFDEIMSKRVNFSRDIGL
jgi:predicted DNA-binding antitoxin AbrB/MazE fold protein